jgi:hypothetical protein
MQSTFYSPNRRYQDDEDTRFQCRHIFPDGHRCGSPCLRSEELCYYHHTTRRPIENAPARKARRGSFSLNTADLVDRSGIQLAIAEVLQRIALNDIDPRRAGLLLYGLQTASLNLPKPPAKPEPVILVDEITHHPTLGILAPQARITDLEPKSSIQRLLDELDLKPEDTAPEDLLEPTTLPEIQACAATQSTPNPNPLRTLPTNSREGECRTSGAPSIRGLMRMGGMNNPSAKLTTDGILPLRQAQRPGNPGRNTRVTSRPLRPHEAGGHPHPRNAQ